MISIIDTYLHLVATPPADSLLYLGVYSPGMVLLSIGIAMFSSYTALLVADFAERSESARTKQILLTLGGVALGAGIWSMHFVGMLGFALPCGVSYDPWVTGFSMIPGGLASIFALRLISQSRMTWKLLLLGGTLLGAGIGVMHYAGMAAMRMDALLRYDAWLFLLSIIVAVVLAMLALWIRTGIARFFPRIGHFAMFVSAIVMGGAVSGMHYTAMAAAYFVRDGDVQSTQATQAGFDPLLLAVVIASATGLLIGIVLIYVFRHSLQEMEQANARSRAADERQRQEADHNQRALQLNVWSGKLTSALQQSDNDTASFGRVVLSELLPQLGGAIGAFFVRETHEQAFHCVAGYGIATARCPPIHPGEGVAGAVALTKTVMVCRDIPPGYLGIESGTVAIDPLEIAVIPIVANGDVLALIEIGYLDSPNAQAEILAEAMPVIAFSLALMLGKLTTLAELNARADSEARQRLVLGAVGDGIVGLDTDGKMTFVNPAVSKLLGYAEDELLNATMHALVHHHYPDGREFPRDECSMYLTTIDGQPRTVDDEVLWRKDGSALSVEYSTTPVVKDGKVLGSVVVFRDITERQAAAEALRHANEEQVAIFESLTHGIGFIKDRIILRANTAHAQLFGRVMDEIEGHSTRIWYPDDEAFVVGGEAVKGDLVRGITHVREQQLMRKDGSLFWCHISARAIDPNDLSRGLVCVLEDVTELRMSEAKLAERMGELERFNRLTIDREEKMIELKKEINELLSKSGQGSKYRIVS